MGGSVAKTTGGASATEHKIEEFAEDLGRILGTAQAKAKGWLGQRQQIAMTLERIRDTATGLLSQLGHEAQAVVRRGRALSSRKREPDGTEAPPSSNPVRRRRKMSAAARKAISDAQKKRWAKVRAEQKKSR
jgi:hypothetical protein